MPAALVSATAEKQGSAENVPPVLPASSAEGEPTSTTAAGAGAVSGAAAAAATDPKPKSLKRKRDDEPVAGTGTSTPKEWMEATDLLERGSDATITTIFDPARFGPSSEMDVTVDKYLRMARLPLPELPLYNVDLMTISLQHYMEADGTISTAVRAVAQRPLSDFHFVDWDQKDVKRFEAGLADWGADMNQLKKLLPGKTVPQIVRFYYSWKTSKLRDQWRAEQAAQHSKIKPKPKEPEFYTATSAGTTRAVSPSLSVLDFPTAAANGHGPHSSHSHGNRSCFMCSSSTSSVWYKGPASWSNRALCQHCGVYWRKYAAESTTAQELVATQKKPAAEELGLGVLIPVVTARANKDDRAAPKPPPPKAEPVRCVYCRRIEPKRRLVSCTRCSMSVHIGCHGIDERDLPSYATWMCEPCTNEKMRFANLNPECILCPAREAEKLASGNSNLSSALRRTKTQMMTVPDEGDEAAGAPPPPLTALEAVKPTESNNWAHTLCAIWIPEIAFSNASSLSYVEGAGFLPLWRYQATCEICDLRHGACVTCAESSCKNTFHVSCAYARKPDYTFAFEIQPVKGSRRDAVPTVAFKDETGNMSALIWCKEHREQAKVKKLYEQHEIDVRTGLSVMQLYARTHKTIQAIAPTVSAASLANVSYALLRRAKRLDAITATSAVPSTTLTSSSAHVAHRDTHGSSGAPSQPRTEPSSGTSTNAMSLSNINHATNAVSSGSRGAYGLSFYTGPQPIREADNAARKKIRLDFVARSAEAEYECVRCKTHFSPGWWPLDVDAEAPAAGDGGSTDAAAGSGENAMADVVMVDSIVPSSWTPWHRTSSVSPMTGVAVGPAEGRRVCCNRCRPYERPDLRA